MSLRTVDRTDAQQVVRWIDDAETWFAWTGHVLPFGADGAQLLAVAATPLGLWVDDQLVGYGEVTFDEVNRSARLGRVVVAPAARGNGVGGELVSSLARWAARRGAHRVDLLVAERNIAAIRCYQRTGFTLEGTSRDARYFAGTYRSMHQMALVLATPTA